MPHAKQQLSQRTKQSRGVKEEQRKSSARRNGFKKRRDAEGEAEAAEAKGSSEEGAEGEL